MKILVVDDESLARARLCRFIETASLGDVVCEAQNGVEAIEAVEKAGATVVAVAVVVDRDTGAKQIIEEAGYPYRAALGLADLGLA